MAVGDLDSGLGSQGDFLLWDVILADGEDRVEVEESKESCVVESRRGIVVVEE